MSHPNCVRPHGHTCQEPSGRTCLERPCTEPAGTRWGPLWCPEHDAIRLDRIGESPMIYVFPLDSEDGWEHPPDMWQVIGEALKAVGYGWESAP